MIDWNDLRYVLAVARHGSLSGAGRRLGVDQTTVGRRIQAAEKALGTRLFDRVDGRIVPTRACDMALQHAERVEGNVFAMLRGVSGQDQALVGAVRVTSVPTLINHLLAPRAGVLLDRHPGLKLELISSSQNLSLSRREADVALRLGRPKKGTALIRRIATVEYAVYACASAAGKKNSFSWVTFDDALAHLPEAVWIAKAMPEGESAAIKVMETESVREVLAATRCRSLLPCFIGDRDSRLTRLSGRAVAISRDVWLMCHRELRRTARVGAVIDWIEDACAQGLRIEK